MTERHGEKSIRRMSERERRNQLTEIMISHFARAESQSDFSAAVIAAEAEVSEVYFYKLVGEEFKELRAGLAGPRRSPDSDSGQLRRELADCQRHLKELKGRYELAVKNDLGEAIRLIEQYDERERRFVLVIKMLVNRLKQCGQTVELAGLVEI